MAQLADALAQAIKLLDAARVPSPVVDAREIASHLSGVPTMELGLKARDLGVPEGFWDAVNRRVKREPLQYILGTAPFGPLQLHVGPGVFIPRPETELLADWAIEHLPQGGVVVDLCTGSGAIACYIATLRPDAKVWAVELSRQAYQWAERNINAHGLTERVTLCEGDATSLDTVPELRFLAGSVDVVVSNPPYVPENLDLEPEVYADPAMAVFAGADGMETIPGVAATGLELLRPGGVLALEHDEVTSISVIDTLRSTTLCTAIVTMKDLAGRPRFATAVRAGGSSN